VNVRRSILLGVVGTVVIGATFVLRTTTRSPASAEGSTVPTTTAVSVTTVVVQPSAVDIALRAVRLTGDIATAGFISRNDLLDSVASTRFAPTMRSTAATQLTEFTTAVGASGVPAADVVWEELPLTATVSEQGASSARVTVWSVLIVGVPGHGSARQIWRTSTIGLVHEVSGWRVDSWTATPGPTPSPASNGAVSDLPSVVEVLSWPPATAEVA
jgi:hypothetical protein